ncbi:unnamed protein product, partial [Effrenium voratum]
MAFAPPARSTVLEFYLNGEKVKVADPDPRQMLIEYLRDAKGLSGTKRSCLQGGCGACVVAVQEYDVATSRWLYRSVNSCLKPLVSCHGLSVTTVEGVGSERKCLHQVQKRIAENHGMQCGFCTPGMVMNTYALLRSGGKPTAEESMKNYDGNICRCTGYRNLVQASESFCKDASPEALALAERCGQHDADVCDKISSREHHSMEKMSESVTFAKDGFTWYAPLSLGEVLEFKKANPRAMYVLGDTAKGIRQAAYEVMNGRASHVISLRHVTELNVLTKSGAGLTIGGALTIQHIVEALERMQTEHSDLQWPSALAEAMKYVAQHHIRSEAGWAGNLLITIQRGFPSDLFPALLAADAEVSFVTTNAQDEKRIPIADFKPGAVPFNALLTKLHIPNLGSAFFKYYRVGQRKWLSHSFASAGFRVTVDGSKKITEARVSTGYWAATPSRSLQAEAALVGSTFDTATLQKAIAAVHSELEFAEERQFQTVDNPEGKDKYRRNLPDSYLFKFFQEAQSFYGIKSWPDEMGTLSALPLKAGNLQFQEVPGLENKPQCSANGLTTGSVRYTDDQPIPALFGYPVLSEASTGKLESLDVAEALKVEGVVDIITAVDIPGQNCAGFVPGEEPVF